ncbi:hypothetical protein HMPREF9973_09497, partial [Staphylococcus epidermidis NIH05001]
ICNNKCDFNRNNKDGYHMGIKDMWEYLLNKKCQSDEFWT